MQFPPNENGERKNSHKHRSITEVHKQALTLNKTLYYCSSSETSIEAAFIKDFPLGLLLEQVATTGHYPRAFQQKTLQSHF